MIKLLIRNLSNDSSPKRYFLRKTFFMIPFF